VTTNVTSTVTGRLNTSNLNALSGNTDGPYAAATACYTQTFGGHGDWYLPAGSSTHTTGEMGVIWTNLSNGIIQNNFSLGTYWSSTENSNSSVNANQLSFGTGTGSGSGTGKTTAYYVRCARRDN
jgi:hypothetical protein